MAKFQQACNQSLALLRQCQLATSGEYHCGPTPNTETVTLVACNAACFAKASCGELNAYFCNSSDDSALTTCLSACLQTNEARFVCDNGAEIPSDFQCDGFEDCEDNSDEDGCPTFTCSSGESISEARVCDGFETCQDGSDEAGCPIFNCQNGDTIFADLQCNGSADCSDGSDEVGCPGRFACTDRSRSVLEYQLCDGENDCDDGSDESASCSYFDCGDGQKVVHTAQCNLNEECNNGADEEGCAQLTPMCE